MIRNELEAAKVAFARFWGVGEYKTAHCRRLGTAKKESSVDERGSVKRNGSLDMRSTSRRREKNEVHCV